MYVNKLKHFNSAICLNALVLPPLLTSLDYRAFAEPEAAYIFHHERDTTNTMALWPLWQNFSHTHNHNVRFHKFFPH